MKLKNALKFSTTKIFREKDKTVIYLVFITLCLTMLFLMCSIAFNTNFVIDKNINDSGIREMTLRLKLEEEIQEGIVYIEELSSIRGLESVALEEPFTETRRFKVMLKDYRGIKNVTMELESKERYQIYMNTEIMKKIPMVSSLKFVSGLMFLIIIMLCFVVIYVVMSDSLNESKTVMSIYKAIGYRNKDLKDMLLSECLLLGAGGYLISAVFSSIVMSYVINPLLVNKFIELTDDMNFTVGRPVYLIVLVGLVAIIYLSSATASFNLKKISPIMLLRE